MTVEDANPHDAHHQEDFECNIEEFKELWENPDNYLVTGGIIYEIEIGSIWLIECPAYIYLQILDRMRAAGVKEVSEIPEELKAIAEKNRHGRKAPRGFEQWMEQNRPKKSKKKE